MGSSRYCLGLDYGTNTARALIVDARDGAEIAGAVAPYPSAEEGILTDASDPLLARQNPLDYEATLLSATREALEHLDESVGPGARETIIGIGIGATASTPIAVDEELRPLARQENFKDDPAAMAWLWKDHTAHGEADEITRLASDQLPHYLERCGGTYSSEWSLAKLLRFLRTAPETAAAAADWVELGDYLCGTLTGCGSPAELPRNVCAAGHKGFYHDQEGPPPAEFLEALDPLLSSWFAARPATTPQAAGTRGGALCGAWAKKLGLPEGIPVSIAAIDAHVGAVGAGVRVGRLAKVMGTSGCDMAVHPADSNPPPSITGLCGIVRDSILPGAWGLEAGQSALGDIFGWFVREFTAAAGIGHEDLTRQAEALEPGQSGLLALDWNNGNRSILANPRLTGLLLGQTLQTRPFEVYRALLEATAFGARTIIEQIRASGVAVDEIVVCGGIAGKNPLLLQIYADVLGMPLELSASEQTCALGAAIFAAVAAGPDSGGYGTVEEAQQAMTGTREGPYEPRVSASGRESYDELYSLYSRLHDAFGGVNREADLGDVMKNLSTLRERAGQASS